jgi:hypothetical protein
MRDTSVVGLLGGLGNQLFQVALGHVLEERGGVAVTYDASAYRSTPDYLGLRDLGLDLPLRRGTAHLPYPIGRRPRIAAGLRRLAGPPRVRLERPDTTAERVLAAAASPAWWYGYWQLPELVRIALPRLRRELCLETPPPAQRIGLHVRRGDMLAAEGGVPAAVYRAAADRVQAATGLPIEVVSDDIPWCRAQLGVEGATFREGGTAAEDLRALADSAHLICSPSTFSWWAATLRPRDPATVLAPPRFPSTRPLRDPAWPPL